MSLSPEARKARAQIGAHVLWSRVTDRAAHTAPARAAMIARFERIVDPAGVLDPADRADRAAHAHQAHMISMALKSAKARRRLRSDTATT